MGDHFADMKIQGVGTRVIPKRLLEDAMIHGVLQDFQRFEKVPAVLASRDHVIELQRLNSASAASTRRTLAQAQSKVPKV